MCEKDRPITSEVGFPHPPVPVGSFVPDPPRVINKKPHLADVRRELEQEEGKEWMANHEIIQLTRVDWCFVVLPRDRDRAKDFELLRQTEVDMMRQLVEEHLDELAEGHDLELFIREVERYAVKVKTECSLWEDDEEWGDLDDYDDPPVPKRKPGSRGRRQLPSASSLRKS